MKQHVDEVGLGVHQSVVTAMVTYHFMMMYRSKSNYIIGKPQDFDQDFILLLELKKIPITVHVLE